MTDKEKLDALLKAVTEFVDSLEFGRCKSYLKVSSMAFRRFSETVEKITGHKIAL